MEYLGRDVVVESVAETDWSSTDDRHRPEDRNLSDFLPDDILRLVLADGQRAIPAIAKDRTYASRIEKIVQRIPTRHRLIVGDSRDLQHIRDASVHLALTSPPYWTLKEYPEREGQLGAVEGYDSFLQELDRVWRNVLRVLVPGGRLVVVVGDVCIARRRRGRHTVVPLHAGIQEHCREIGFDNLAPIIWYKISNAKYEAENGSRFLGKPYEPNAIIKNDIEFILFQRKPGGYRKPSLPARALSVIPQARHREWFSQVWRLGGASTAQHPAPFPVPLAERLIRMFSFVGDVVLDPFVGTGTTAVAAGRWGRDSIGVDIEEVYLQIAASRLLNEKHKQLHLEGMREPTDDGWNKQARLL